MRQFSYTFQTPTNEASTYRFKAHPFLRPDEFLSVVAQDNGIKLHALVDEAKPQMVYEILIVGTGQAIDDSLIERLYKVGSVLLHGQYGYHVYYLGATRQLPIEEATKTPEFALHLEWKADLTENEREDYDNLDAKIDRFVADHVELCELMISDDADHFYVVFFDAEFRQHPDFSALMLSVCANTALKTFSLAFGNEIDV
jgi:hypothetical protein